MSNLSSDALMFADEGIVSEREPPDCAGPWKILLVDDEPQVHAVTELSLRDVEVHGRPLSFLHAYTGKESIEVMRREPDIAMVLMDVVMETEHAGLEAVDRIRGELNNSDVRVILRTGQPGQAPEREVVARYDINDYKEKTELTASKMHTLVYTSLSHYRELVALKQNREGLEKVIEASGSLFESSSLVQFARGVLKQLSALLYANDDTVMVRGVAVGADIETGPELVITASSNDDSMVGERIEDVLPQKVVARIRRSLDTNEPYFGDGYFTVFFKTSAGAKHVVYMTSDAEFSVSDHRLVALFCRNVGVAFENHSVNQEMLSSQRKLVLMLSAVVEERSPELKNHVVRVSEYAKIIGRNLNLSALELEELELSAAMHDVGKISIPDVILNKPGRFTSEERILMQDHVARGEAILDSQHSSLLKSARRVVGTHHERWDGKGYPRQLSGKDIPLFGRITSVADVFDALSTPRVYKEPWPVDTVFDYLREHRGSQFDPELVDIFLANRDAVMDVFAKYHS